MSNIEASSDVSELKTEIVRLNKIIQALMNRVEKGTNCHGSDFSLFQTSLMLEDLVRARTAQLEESLSENRRITQALVESESRFRGVVDQSMVGISIIENGTFVYTNPKFAEIFGYTAEEILNISPMALAAESDRKFIAENVRQRLCGEITKVGFIFKAVTKTGSIRDIELDGTSMKSGGKNVLISLLIDITERLHAEREVKELHEKLREQSIRDPLTGLYNRRYLEESLERELVLAFREEHPVSIIMGDLDHFKKINDSFGHLAGDQVLRVFADLIKRSARGSDICCRYGGEEFILVLPRMTEKSSFDRAEQLRREIQSSPVIYGDLSISVTCSFGIASFPVNGMTGNEVIAAADSALYSVKEAGRNQVGVCSKS